MKNLILSGLLLSFVSLSAIPDAGVSDEAVNTSDCVVPTPSPSGLVMHNYHMKKYDRCITALYCAVGTSLTVTSISNGFAIKRIITKTPKYIFPVAVGMTLLNIAGVVGSFAGVELVQAKIESKCLQTALQEVKKLEESKKN